MGKFIITITLVIASIIFAGISATAQNRTATKNIKINLDDVISIDKGSGATDRLVGFTYLTAADNNSTKTRHVPARLIVTSTKNFDIDVKANGAYFKKGSDLIPVNVLTIKPVTGNANPMTGTPSNVVLSTRDQNLISGADLGVALVLELDYEIPQTLSSSADMNSKPAGIYTQAVTYTATVL